jgi:hypothetical protein
MSYGGPDGTAAMDDSPEQGLKYSYGVKVYDKFHAHLMYLPPGHGATWVSLERVKWHWEGEALWDGVWVLQPGAAVKIDSTAEYQRQPEWTDVVVDDGS